MLGARRVTRRKRSFVQAWALLLTGCAPAAIVHRVEAAHPDATFEANVRGCEFHPPLAGRQFGSDFSKALLWSRQVAGTARYSQCEVVIEANEHGTRTPLYRITQDASGARSEGAIISPP
jgi:hypothetical protein